MNYDKAVRIMYLVNKGSSVSTDLTPIDNRLMIVKRDGKYIIKDDNRIKIELDNLSASKLIDIINIIIKYSEDIEYSITSKIEEMIGEINNVKD